MEHPDDEIGTAVAALEEDMELERQFHEQQIDFLKRISGLVERAEAQSGNTGLTVQEALSFLAQQGDPQAVGLIKELSGSF